MSAKLENRQEFSTRTVADDDEDEDAELLRRCKTQCRRSFQKLYERHYRAIVRLAYRYLNDTHLVEDVANETMFTVWQKASTFRRESRVKTWILGIAVLKCHEARRKQRSSHIDERVDVESERLVVEAGNLNDSTSNIDLERDIQTAMQRLSPEHRICIELAYVEGFSGAEIADVVGCPLNTVKTRLHYAKKQLKAFFQQQHQALKFTDYADDFNSQPGGDVL